MSDTLGLQDKSREKQLEASSQLTATGALLARTGIRPFPIKSFLKLFLQGFFFYHRYTFSALV